MDCSVRLRKTAAQVQQGRQAGAPFLRGSWTCPPLGAFLAPSLRAASGHSRRFLRRVHPRPSHDRAVGGSCPSVQVQQGRRESKRPTSRLNGVFCWEWALLDLASGLVPPVLALQPASPACAPSLAHSPEKPSPARPFLGPQARFKSSRTHGCRGLRFY